MRKAKTTQGLIFITLIIIALISISFITAKSRKAVTCKESLEECCQKKAPDTGSDMLFENLSRQFISAVKTDL